MKHAFIVEVAEKIGIEPAIIEATLAYRANKYGRNDGSWTTFFVSEAEMESSYPYFKYDIYDSVSMVCNLLVFDDPVYIADRSSINCDAFYKVSVDNRWLEFRESL